MKKVKQFTITTLTKGLIKKREAKEPLFFITNDGVRDDGAGVRAIHFRHNKNH